jgi:hypothetical protein
MLVKRQLSDFYTVKLKKPFTDKNAFVLITITVDQPHLVVVEPNSLFLDFHTPSVNVKISSQSTEDFFLTDAQFKITHTT